MPAPTQNPVLNAVCKALRTTRPKVSIDYYARIEKVPYGNLVDIWFRTRGCSFDYNGSCTMCNYDWSLSTSSDQQASFVKQALDEIKIAPYELLISPSGSMLDEKEVPMEARKKIFDIASKQPCNLFLFETRPETVTNEALVEYHKAFAKTQHKIGVEVGLESSNQWILTYCVNKQLSLYDFENAVQLIKRNGMLSYANISLGTAFLTEQEAIQDAVTSIHWALSKGVDKIVLFPLHVKTYTVLHWLWRNGLYTPTSLWALPEVLKRLGPDIASKVELAWYKPISETGISSYPIPKTCGDCYSDVIQLLDLYKKTMNYKYVSLLDKVSCPCHDAWRERIVILPDTSLADRVFSAYESMIKDVLGKTWWEEQGRAFVADAKLKVPPSFKNIE